MSGEEDFYLILSSDTSEVFSENKAYRFRNLMTPVLDFASGDYRAGVISACLSQRQTSRAHPKTGLLHVNFLRGARFGASETAFACLLPLNSHQTFYNPVAYYRPIQGIYGIVEVFLTDTQGRDLSVLDGTLTCVVHVTKSSF